MDIEKRLEGDILVISLSGDFDTTEAENFGAEIAAAIEDGSMRVLLHLAGLEFVNSTGLGSLLRAQRQMAQYGGGMAVCEATESVKKTFRILELDRRLPLFPDEAAAIAHLCGISPEQVSGTGEEVEFFVPDAEDSFGARPRRGRLCEMFEEGLSLLFDNLDGIDPDATFTAGVPVSLRFLLPLYHPTHVFQVEGRILEHEDHGRETIKLRVEFTSLSEVEQSAVSQYVKDLRYLREEG